MDKFKALAHFFMHECRDNPEQLGLVRLNKALWMTDVLAYQRDGASVTGERYVKKSRGPVPPKTWPTLRELEKERKIRIQEPEHDCPMRTFVSFDAPDMSPLSESDRQLAKDILDIFRRHPENAVSELTHDDVWEAAAMDEEIPMYATLAAERGEVTDEIMAWADEVVQSIAQQEAHA